MSQLSAVPTATTSLAQRLQAQQAAIKTEAHDALGSFNERLQALMAEANDLTVLNGVFSKPVEETLSKFVAYARSTLDVTQPAVAKVTPSQPAQAIAA